jgi:hypothetical protein
MTAIPAVTLRNSRVAQFFRSAFAGSRILSLHAIAMLVCFAFCLVLQTFDARDFNGANVWLKPGKFFLSLAVHVATIAWALSFATPALRQTRTIRWSVLGLLISAWFELIYITYRASLGEASHFNTSTPLNGYLYNLMAVGSVVLVVAAAVIALAIWQSKPRAIWTEAIALGFSLGAFLTLIVGFTLGANSGHWIGGDLTDATALPVFKWSTTGGDLRVAHFIGLHAMQIVPFAAVFGSRKIVWSSAAVMTVLTLAAFAQALMGLPLLRL